MSCMTWVLRPPDDQFSGEVLLCEIKTGNSEAAEPRTELPDLLRVVREIKL